MNYTNSCKTNAVFVYTRDIADVSQPLKASDIKKVKVPARYQKILQK